MDLIEWRGGAWFGGGRASDLGRVMDGQRQGRLILFRHAARFKSCPRTDRYLHSFGIIREYLSFGRMPNDILLQD
mgnify:FL=1